VKKTKRNISTAIALKQPPTRRPAPPPAEITIRIWGRPVPLAPAFVALVALAASLYLRVVAP